MIPIDSQLHRPRVQEINLLYSGELIPASEVTMRKMTIPLACAAVSALALAVMSMTTGPAGFYAQTRPVSSYAEDRAAIEDLQARYLFALDFHDPDLYVSTFTEDGRAGLRQR